MGALSKYMHADLINFVCELIYTIGELVSAEETQGGLCRGHAALVNTMSKKPHRDQANQRTFLARKLSGASPTYQDDQDII
eukprot:1900918-Amphidinium_carterae.1